MIDVEITNRHKVLHTFLLYSMFQGFFFSIRFPHNLDHFVFGLSSHITITSTTTIILVLFSLPWLLLHNVHLFFIQYCSMNQSLHNLNHSAYLVLPDTILVLFSLTGTSCFPVLFFMLSSVPIFTAFSID